MSTLVSVEKLLSAPSSSDSCCDEGLDPDPSLQSNHDSLESKDRDGSSEHSAEKGRLPLENGEGGTNPSKIDEPHQNKKQVRGVWVDSLWGLLIDRCISVRFVSFFSFFIVCNNLSVEGRKT